ncbi:MAG: hypothetical protein A2147_05525 [Chloroflexi bacterium RBG_16_57_8]|nr:MAG: hypothetical protein A2147_05525 [Chloroflexi bacterium RBG_16_57_8]
MVRQEALSSGVPAIRYLHGSRTRPGPEDVDSLVEPILKEMTRPLTDEEKQSGRWEPSRPDRLLFEGTLDEAQAFYQQTKYIGLPVNAPISLYTDGYPIIVPTEERVAEMLKGTSHKPDELIVHQSERVLRWGVRMKPGDPVAFQQGVQSSRRTATVEKVAINAVMAGCKPEHLPIILAIAESGCGTGTTNFPSQAVCLSGPIVKQIGLNTGCGHLGPGSPVNGPIGRAFQLMAINLSGAIPGVNRMGCHGSPINNGGTCFGENADGLPPGWLGMNEESGFDKNESVVMVMLNIGGGIVGSQFSPGGYRAFQKSGHGGMARRFDVKGRPGPHNWLEYIVPGLWAAREGAFTFVMVPEMARHLLDYGFKSKDDAYDWLYKQSFITIKDFKGRSWPDYQGTNGWTGIEKTSGRPWRELPDDYMVALVDDPFDSLIIVAGGEEEASVQFGGGRGPVYSIDVWR